MQEEASTPAENSASPPAIEIAVGSGSGEAGRNPAGEAKLAQRASARRSPKAKPPLKQAAAVATPMAAAQVVASAAPARTPSAAPAPARKIAAAAPAPPREHPSAAQAASPARAADSPADSVQHHSFLLFRATPGWLVSMIVHAALLIVLALWHLRPPVEDLRKIVMLGEESELEELDLFEPTKIEVQEEVSSQAFAAGDIGMANFGAPQLVTAMTAVDMAAFNPTVGEIGQLFGAEGKGLADTGSGYGGAQFFGVKAGGRKFVFIVDSSLSMRKGKFDAARVELEQAVRRLTEDQLFYVMFFDWDSNRLRLGQWDRQRRNWTANAEPEERAVFATNENKAHVEEWMKTVELELKTLVYDSVVTALEMYPDAIYILTDGKFGDTAKVERYLAQNNYIHDEQGDKRAKIIIHTVGFYSRDGEPVLKKMADDYGGTYRFVAEPGK